MHELTHIVTANSDRQRKFNGFNLDWMLTFSLVDQKENGCELIIELAIPNKEGDPHQLTFHGREAKAMAKYIEDLSREVKPPPERVPRT